MYLVYDGKHKITDNPISLHWLYNMFASVWIPDRVAHMKPGECVTVTTFKIVKV
jgi:hypothetical protein